MSNFQVRARLLILAMAAIAVALFALAQHGVLERERRAADSIRAELALARDKLQAAEGQAAKAAKELEAARSTTGAELTSRIESLQKELAARDQATQAALAQIQTKLGEASAAATQLAGLTARLDEALKAREAAAQLGARVAALEQQLKEREAQAAAATQERDRLKGQLDGLRGELATLQGAARGQMETPTGTPASVERPAPAVPVVTSVEHVDEAAAVVVVGAGTRSGLEVGHTLLVTRDGRPIGRLRVLKANDDLAGAEILGTEPGERVQVSDRASTRAAKASDPPAAASNPAATTEIPLGKAPPPPPPSLPELLGK